MQWEASTKSCQISQSALAGGEKSMLHICAWDFAQQNDHPEAAVGLGYLIDRSVDFEY